MFLIRRTLTRPITQLSLIPILAVVLTSLTSLVLVYGNFANAGQYGFPLVWKTRVECNGVIGEGPAVACGYTKYWWEFFALNTALYMGVGYSILLIVKKRWSLFAPMIVPVLAGWLTSATIYIFSTAQTVWRNGFPLPYGAVSSGYGWIYFEWVLFALNMALYMGLGYSIVFLVKERWSLLVTTMIPALAGWLTFATIFFSVTTKTGPWTNGFPVPYATVSAGFGWIDFNWVLFAIDTMLIATLEFLVFFLYRGFTRTTISG